jgi:hypothetical protein
MNWLSSIPIIGKLFDDTAEIIKEAVTDKDKQLKILENLEQIKMQADKEIYIKELETKTVTWVDALHKMARTILNVMVIIAVVILSLKNIEITPTMALVLGGGNVAYQLIKGAGNKPK